MYEKYWNNGFFRVLSVAFYISSKKRKESDFMVETKSQKEPSDVYDRFTQELDEKQRRAFEKLTQKQKLAIIKDYLRKY